MIETLQPSSYTPDLSKARKVNFSKPDEVKEDLKKDKVLRREANAIANQNRRTIKQQEKAWREYELKKSQANRAIYRAQLALDRANERLKAIEKPLEIGFTPEDQKRVNRFLTNGGAHAKRLVGIPSFLELESVYVEPRQEVSSQT